MMQFPSSSGRHCDIIIGTLSSIGCFMLQVFEAFIAVGSSDQRSDFPVRVANYAGRAKVCDLSEIAI